MEPFSNLDDFHAYAQSLIIAPSDSMDKDEEDQQLLQELRKKGHEAFPNQTGMVDSFLADVNRSSRIGKGRYVNPNLALNTPWIDPSFDELNEEEQVDRVEQWREQIPQYALQDPLNYEDNKYFMNQLANEKLRHVQGDDTGWLADKGWRAFDAVAAGIASKLGAQETADAIRAWSEENPNTDSNFSSALIQGFGDVGASAAIFFATTALTGGNIAVGSAALAATTGIERYTTTYKEAIEKGLSKDQAHDAGLGSLPGAAVDYFADRLVIGKVLPKNLDDILASGSTAAKRKALGDVFKNKDLRAEAMKLSRDFFVQGASEAAGDFTAGYGAYLMTGEESFVPKNEELAMSFLVGGIIGSTFSGYESVGDRIQNRKGRDIFAARDRAEANAAAQNNNNPNSAAAAANAEIIPTVIPMGQAAQPKGETQEAPIPSATDTPGGLATVDFNAPISTLPSTIGSFSPYPDTINLANYVSEEEVSLPVFQAYVQNEFGSVEPLFDTPIRPLSSGMTETERALSGMLTIPQVQMAQTGSGMTTDLRNVTPFTPTASITTATPAIGAPAVQGLPAPASPPAIGLPAPESLGLPAPQEQSLPVAQIDPLTETAVNGVEAPRQTAILTVQPDGTEELRVNNNGEIGMLLAVKKGNRHYLALQRPDGTPKLSKQISKAAFDQLVEENRPVPVPVATPAAQLEVAPEPPVNVDTQISLFESNPNTIAKDRVIDAEVSIELESVLETLPEVEATTDEIIEQMEDLFTNEGAEPSNPKFNPSSVFLMSRNGQIQVIPYGTQNMATGMPYLDRVQTKEVEQAAVNKLKSTDVNIYDGDSLTVVVVPTETGFEAQPIATEVDEELSEEDTEEAPQATSEETPESAIEEPLRPLYTKWKEAQAKHAENPTRYTKGQVTKAYKKMAFHYYFLHPEDTENQGLIDQINREEAIEAANNPVEVNNPETYPAAVTNYLDEETATSKEEIVNQVKETTEELQPQPLPPKEDPGSEPYEWEGGELTQQTNALDSQPWENTPVATPTAAIVEQTLSEDEKQEAAIELGLDSWTLDAADRFVAKMADWLVSVQSVTSKLASLIKKVWDSIRIPSILASVAFNLNPNVADYAPAITSEQVMSDINNYDASAPLPSAPTTQGTIGDIEDAAAIAETFEPTQAAPSPRPKADFRGATASGNVRTMTKWILENNDNQGKPFTVAEKPTGLVYFFDANGVLVKKAPALYGSARGDLQSAKAGLTLDQIRKTPSAQVTAAGRFETTSSTSKFDDYGESVQVTRGGVDSNTWIHKVFLGREATENRTGKLKSETGADNRISLGCINLLEADMIAVRPLVREGSIMYVLPETQEGKQLFEGFEDIDLSETEAPAQRTGFRLNKRKKGMASGSVINPAGAIKKAFKVLAGSTQSAEATPNTTQENPPNILGEAAKQAHEKGRVPAFVLNARKTGRRSRANEPRVKSIVGNVIKIYSQVKTKAQFTEELRRNYGDAIANLSDQLWTHFKENGVTDLKIPNQLIRKVVNKVDKRPDILPSNVKIYDETVTPIEQHGINATNSLRNQQIPSNNPKGDAELHAVTANLKSKDPKIRAQAERKRDSQIKRLNRVKRLKIDDRYDTATDQIARLLSKIDVPKINQMANHHIDQFYELVDHIYNSRSNSVRDPDLREYSQGIINTLQNFRYLIDSHHIRKMMKDLGDVMDFSGYDGAIDDRDSFEKYIDNLAKSLKLDVAKMRKKNAEAQKAKTKLWKTKIKANIQRILAKHKDAESWISQMEKDGGGKFRKTNRDLLKLHWDYMTRLADYENMEGVDLYNHGFELNNMYDGQPIYIPETSVKYIANQMNKGINFKELANMFRDPYVTRNSILEGFDKAQEKIELQQTKLGRLSAFEEGKKFLMNEVMGPLMDSINQSVNDQKSSIDRMIAAKKVFKEVTGRDFDYNDSKWLAIAGRLVQYRIGHNMNSEFRKNMENEREQIANVIGGGKKKKKARGTSAMRADKEDSLKKFERLIEGLDNSNKPMEDFMATIYNRLGDGDETIGKARFDLLSTMQELCAEYTLDAKLIAQNFYKNKKGKSSFEEYANYMSRRVIPISPERKGKDELTGTAEELEDKLFQSQSFTAEPEQLKDRTSIGSNGYYSDNIDYIFERSIRVSAVTANTTLPRFVLKERLKEGNGIYELIENDTGTQERIDYMHRWAVGVTQNALHSGMPMNALGKVVRAIKEAFTRSSLSGLHHIVSQIAAGLSDYHARTGNIGGAMEAMAFVTRNKEKADAFFTAHAARVMDRSIRGESELDRRRMPTMDPSALANNPTIKKLDKIYGGVSRMMTISLEKGDDVTAKGLVLAEYIRLMKEKGHIIPSVDDMDFEVVDQRLLTQAVNDVELNINSSDKITRGDLYVDRDPRISILRDCLLLFSSHNMALSGQFSQAIRDLLDLKALGASKEKMELQSRTIAAIATQTAIFASSRYAIGAAMAGAMIGLMRDLYDDEEGKIAELELRVRHAQSTGDDVLIATAKADLAQATAISKSINAFQERNQSWKGYFQSVLKDELGVVHFAFSGPGLPQKLIFPVVDNFNEKMYKSSLDAEIVKLDKRIKAAEKRRNFTEAAKLEERKVMLRGAEYLPWHVESIGNIGVGGITGAALQNIFTNVDEMREAAFGLREYSFNDLAISATALGLGQSEVTRYFRQVDKIEDDMYKRDAARIDQIKKAKARQDEQDARKETERLRRLLTQ